MSDWDDAQAELNAPGAAGFYKPSRLPVGESEEVTLVGYAKWTETKYPIKDKDGNSKGYTWRFRLSNGQVWDVSNANRKVLLSGMHPNGQQASQPARFKVTNIGKVVDKKPSVKVELVESSVIV